MSQVQLLAIIHHMTHPFDSIYFILHSFIARPIYIINRLPFNSAKSSSNILLGAPYDVNIVSVRKQLDTCAIALHFRLLQNTVHHELKVVA